MKSYFVYILASKTNGTLYIGVTSNIQRRLEEHINGLAESFTSKYGLKRLVYLEEYQNPTDAIKREKQLKNWKRLWKLNLINAQNPAWKDLSEDI
jgi:putative endonuclease